MCYGNRARATPSRGADGRVAATAVLFASALALATTTAKTEKAERPARAPAASALALATTTAKTEKAERPDRAPAASTLEPEDGEDGVVSRDVGYICGIKIYSIGIKEDPYRGSKRGKGMQHLTSSYWIYDMGVFINREFSRMQTMLAYTRERSEGEENDYDYHYFLNVSNALFLKAEAEGLRTADARDFFLMACWLAMAAAEVDGFQYSKYSRAERAAHRAAFYDKYERPNAVWIPDEPDDPEIERRLGKYAIECPRIDLIPTVALERLGIHNELCALKWDDPGEWMRDGFDVSARLASMKRHYENVHARDASEDHLAHLIWGFMAMTHVIAVFPQRNTLEDFESLRRRNVLQSNVASLVGDGGFRSAIARQSARMPTLNGEEDEDAASRAPPAELAVVRDASGADAETGQDDGEQFATYRAPASTSRTLTPSEVAAFEHGALGLERRDQVHRDGHWHRSVDVWIVDDDDDSSEPTVLLQRRSDLKDTNPGRLDVSCAGHLTGAHASPRQTAMQELSEELGMREPERTLPQLSHVLTAPIEARGETIQRGQYLDREIVDVFVLRWDADVARRFCDKPTARLRDATFTVGVGEVAALATERLNVVLESMRRHDAAFVARPGHYLDAVQPFLARPPSAHQTELES